MPLGVLDIRWIKNDLGFYLENHSCVYMGLPFWNEVFIQTFSWRDQVRSSDLIDDKYSAIEWISEQYVHTEIFVCRRWALWVFRIYWELVQCVYMILSAVWN